MSRNLWPDIFVFVLPVLPVTLDHCRATYCHVRHRGDQGMIDVEHPARRKSPRVIARADAPLEFPSEKSRDLYANRPRDFLGINVIINVRSSHRLIGACRENQRDPNRENPNKKLVSAGTGRKGGGERALNPANSRDSNSRDETVYARLQLLTQSKHIDIH
jgi:hypothetical protein